MCPSTDLNPDGKYTLNGSARITLVDMFHHEFCVIAIPVGSSVPVVLDEEDIEAIVPYSQMMHTTDSFDIDWSLVDPADTGLK